MNTHAELSRDLALAIGYFPESVRIEDDLCYVYRKGVVHIERWWMFDYRSADVALAMVKLLGDKRVYLCKVCDGWVAYGCDSIAYETLPEAAARAVIALKGGE